MLTDKQFWKARPRPSQQDATLSFNPRRPSFSDLDDLFRRRLPTNQNLSFLEVGSYPGKYMWYFNKVFGYRISGVEFVEEHCRKMVRLFSDSKIDAEIIQADFFEMKELAPGRQWDVVGSFGFIEHFDGEDLIRCVRQHWELVSPGGYLVLVVPNHSGFSGKVFKVVDKDSFQGHNQMDQEDLLRVLSEAAPEHVLQESGYYSRFGLFNSGLYRALGSKSYILQRSFISAMRPVELAARLAPNTSYFSPHVAAVAQKPLLQGETSGLDTTSSRTQLRCGGGGLAE